MIFDLFVCDTLEQRPKPNCLTWIFSPHQSYINKIHLTIYHKLFVPNVMTYYKTSVNKHF